MVGTAIRAEPLDSEKQTGLSPGWFRGPSVQLSACGCDFMASEVCPGSIKPDLQMLTSPDWVILSAV